MKITTLEQTPIMDTPHKIDARNLYDKESASISVIRLLPGEKMIPHITPVDAAFYVLEGTGIVEVGEERKEVHPDTLIESPKDIVHCWYNESAEDLRVLIVKAPKQTTKTIFVDE